MHVTKKKHLMRNLSTSNPENPQQCTGQRCGIGRRKCLANPRLWTFDLQRGQLHSTRLTSIEADKKTQLKMSQIVAMFLHKVSSLRRNLNWMNRLEDNGLLFRNPYAWYLLCSEIFLAQKSPASKRDDNSHAAQNGGCGVGAHGPDRGSAVCPSLERFCLWLSFTQITESCIWEPWNGEPSHPKIGNNWHSAGQ